MDLIAAITFAFAGVFGTGMLFLVALLWQTSLKFSSGSWGRRIAAAYSSVITIGAAVVVWLMVGWVSQLLDPFLTGHPGPLALLMFPLAAAWIGVPAGVGMAVMDIVLERRKRIK